MLAAIKKRQHESEIFYLLLIYLTKKNEVM